MDKKRSLKEITSHLPRAGLEAALVLSMPISALTATIGSGIACVMGNQELAYSLAKWGSLGCMGGLAGTITYMVGVANSNDDRKFIAERDSGIYRLMQSIRGSQH